MTDVPLLSVVIPAFNESGVLAETLRSVIAHCDQRGFVYELIVIDDGSTDDTAAIASTFAEKHRRVRLLQHPQNRGKGAAVKTGVLASRGERVLFMDADHSVDIAHIDDFFSAYEAGSDIVIASIAIPGAIVDDVHGKARRYAGLAAKLLIEVCATPGIHDTQRGFKLLRGEHARHIFQETYTERWGFDIEVLRHAQKRALRIRELPVAWHNHKRSNIGISDYLRTLVELFGILRRRY